jgi:hypothetical protein
MRVQIGLPDFRKLADGFGRDIATAATEAMRETTPGALAEIREQTTDAGMGQRMANTWRGRVYPDKGASRHSLEPAGYIWSRAPDIADAFARGATIRPLGGRRFLWIPTEAVPVARGRYTGSGRIKRLPMTPEEVETAYDQDLFYRRGRQGRVLAFVNVVRSKNQRAWRQGTKRRLAQGRALEQILMFVLVPQVKMPRLFDLDGVARRWAARYDVAFGARLEAL